MKQAKLWLLAAPLAVLAFALTGCDGSSKVASADGSGRAQLLRVDIGRLVDIYAFQRIDPAISDRRLRANRQLVLVAQNVVVNPNLESQALFDAGGEEVPSATYEFRPFDRSVGHEELVILWDNRPGPEAARFQDALDAAQQGLAPLAASFRGQNTMLRPIPIVPRNAALRLQFSGAIGLDEEFFRLNPSVIQLLEFKGDPAVVRPADAFRLLPARIIPQGNRIVLDTTILGGETRGGLASTGLPESSDSVTANIRLAIPTRGSAGSALFVEADPVAELNGIESAGRNAVIRDFRSGNLLDGPAGRLAEPEPPMIVASVSMGITAIDTNSKVLTLDKRDNFLPVRGRYPFVDGPLSSSGLPLGPVAAPISQPLRSGDLLIQNRIVAMPDGRFEVVTLRAEILENLQIGTVVGGPLALGLSASTTSGQEQGQLLPQVQVRVASLEAGRDSLGRVWSFEADPTPANRGRDCVLRAFYYEKVPFTGSTLELSDAAWRKRFVRVDPQPTGQLAADREITLVNPLCSLSIEFNKPLDLDQVDPSGNLLLTNTPVGNQFAGRESFTAQMTDPKRATARVVPARLSDVSGDGTLLRLQAPMGLWHIAGTAEVYSIHVKLGPEGVVDLAGTPIKVFDDVTNPLDAWSVDFRLNPAAAQNTVLWHSWLFSDADEDGSLPGSIDIFGQYRLQDGRLFGATGVRFSRNADNQNLGSISRISRGECWDDQAGALVLPTAPVDQVGTPHPGTLYWQPRMLDQIGPPAVPQVYENWQQTPQNVGRVIEPHNPRGSRMQMRYLEDDFSLSYREPAEFGLDVEQMYWSPFNDETVFFDVFDRYSMSLAHSGRRPDIHFFLFRPAPPPPPGQPPPPVCIYRCSANSSALSTVFADNVLPGTQPVSVFEDKVYRINPNEAFLSAQVKYVPYPRFDRSYTWRDSRLITVDANGQVIGLGGADQPNAPDPNDDWTANIDSPWITSAPPANFVNLGFSTYVIDDADFRGNRRLDHDPIALPLLVDFKVFPETPSNGGIANGSNSFQMALLGPPSYGFPALAGGYYDRVGAGCQQRLPWPSVRTQASGGEDLISGAQILVDPATQLNAQQSILKDAGLGNTARALFTAPARDGMLSWSRADFVRKVSTMTFGFIDTLQPQRALFANDLTGTPSVTASTGFPDAAAISTSFRIVDMVTQLDPPQSRQPAGTSVVLELRGAETFANSGVLYNPSFTLAGQTANDTFDGRGNLLNANYACEAYRYAQPNSGTDNNTPRVAATGLTRYVTDDQINLIRDPASQLLPRFLNCRLTMTNNVDVNPPLSPSLRSMSVVYRVQLAP